MSMLDNENPTGDKRTIIAVVISVVLITVSMTVQSLIWPAPKAQPVVEAQQTVQQTAAAVPVPVAPTSAAVPAAPTASVAIASPVGSTVAAAAAIPVPAAARTYTISTDLLEAVLSNKGGDLVSLKLKKHGDKGGAVDLVVPDSAGVGGLSLAFGGPTAAPIADLMNAVQIDDTIIFSRTFYATVSGRPEPQPFTLKKTYSFKDGEYMFGLAVSLENSVNEYLPLDADGEAYTISMGPQIGPRMSVAPNTSGSDYRKFLTQVAGKRKELAHKVGAPQAPKEQPTWAAISGKYFTFIAIPELTSFQTRFSAKQDQALFESDSLSLSRPAIRSSRQTDLYYFYFGPKTNAELSRYDYPDKNGFGRSGLSLENASNGTGILTWLENIMKFFLNIFFKVVPNYGVAIIMVTILVKAILFPLTRNGSISSAKMQEYQPQIKELQEKYKANPQKLNAEMAAFYKKVGFNPMSGCLPLLIQFPIFIAMYNLFNNHFDLRGAMFIPGWISDLSMPEAIVTFPRLNLILWQVDALRILPIVYLVSQLLYGKYTQSTTAGQSAAQMKIMMYGMPIFFFFILYNTPSGLLVYWIVSNLLSIGQQIVINDLLKKRKLSLASEPSVAAPAKVVAPNKGTGKSRKRR
jgi:YidC/Oxa1 family membrane protein insertase